MDDQNDMIDRGIHARISNGANGGVHTSSVAFQHLIDGHASPDSALDSNSEEEEGEDSDDAGERMSLWKTCLLPSSNKS